MTYTLQTISKDIYEDDGLDAFWIPLVIAVTAIGGVAVTGWGLIRGEARRKEMQAFYGQTMKQMLAGIKSGVHPRVVGIATGFEHTQYNSLMDAARGEGVSVAWRRPTTAKINAVLVTTTDGKCVVIVDSVRALAEAVTDANGKTDWEKATSLLSEAKAASTVKGGWFSTTAYGQWSQKLLKLKRDVEANIEPAITGIVGVKPTAKVAVLDWVLILAGLGTAGWLGWQLLRRKPWQKKEPYPSPQISAGS